MPPFSKVCSAGLILCYGCLAVAVLLVVLIIAVILVILLMLLVVAVVLVILLVVAVVLIVAVILLVVVAIEAHLLTSLFIVGIVCLILRKAIHVKTQGRKWCNAAYTKRIIIYYGSRASHQGGYIAEGRKNRKDSSADTAGGIHGNTGWVWI